VAISSTLGLDRVEESDDPDFRQNVVIEQVRAACLEYATGATLRRCGDAAR
jgi:hypothetical protein